MGTDPHRPKAVLGGCSPSSATEQKMSAKRRRASEVRKWEAGKSIRPSQSRGKSDQGMLSAEGRISRWLQRPVQRSGKSYKGGKSREKEAGCRAKKIVGKRGEWRVGLGLLKTRASSWWKGEKRQGHLPVLSKGGGGKKKKTSRKKKPPSQTGCGALRTGVGLGCAISSQTGVYP